MYSDLFYDILPVREDFISHKVVGVREIFIYNLFAVFFLHIIHAALEFWRNVTIMDSDSLTFSLTSFKVTILRPHKVSFLHHLKKNPCKQLL